MKGIILRPCMTGQAIFGLAIERNLKMAGI